MVRIPFALAHLAGIALAVVVIGAPRSALAANTCHGFVTAQYLSTSSFHGLGDVVRVRMILGTGTISGGTMLTLARARFDLDCDAGAPFEIGCTDDGSVVSYAGDGTLTTDCDPTTFSTGHGGGSSPNQIVFTATPPLAIPAGTPQFCTLEFDVRVEARSMDVTPERVEQVAGLSVADGDAGCDNGLTAGGSQASLLELCPECDDTNVCTVDTCDRDTGACENVPGRSDPDGDGEADPTDHCPGTGAGAAVDDAGCSAAQFCATFDATTSEGARRCKKADWQNDEPIMKRGQGDCVVDRAGQGRTDDRCVPVP
jgi:hypothetical protein